MNTLKPRKHYLDTNKPSHIDVFVMDEPDPEIGGGACHKYRVAYLLDQGDGMAIGGMLCDISFQHGSVREHGANGVTEESLLAIVRDRLEAFQSGAYACEENGAALAGVIAAMDALKSRTARREKAGTEGTNALDEK